ncbi:MAG: trigger factor [Lachnospiraceae bacterium]|nr:trigger factor [Lachnospiraceae bacterium]
MNVVVEKIEGNYARLTVTCPTEDFEAAVQQVYLKQKNKIQIDGFRKGKAPRKMIEKIYGEGVFYEDAANDLIDKSYREALETDEAKGLEIQAPPTVEEVKEIGKDQPFVYVAKVALKPEVKLGKYKKLGVEKKTAEVTDEEVDAEVKRTQEQNSRTVHVDDRPIEDGDIAVIDYEGFTDGVPFEGGKGENHELTIGSHSFIDTFEEQLIGKNIGDDVEVNVTFPEEYHAKELAGKKALFKVKIQGIQVKELPELDDEFASEVSEFETMAEYKDDLQKKILDRKQKALDDEYEDAVLRKAVENAKMEIPAETIDYNARQMVNDYARRLEMQGMSLDLFMKYTGQTVEQLRDSFKEQAKKRLENGYVLEAIAEKEKIEVSDEEMKEELENMAKQYQMEFEKLEELVSDEEKENIRKELAVKKALKKIAE